VFFEKSKPIKEFEQFVLDACLYFEVRESGQCPKGRPLHNGS
jgi:hypothetical protein